LACFLEQSRAAVVLSSRWAASSPASFLLLMGELVLGGRWGHIHASVHNCSQHGPEPGQYNSYEVEQLPIVFDEKMWIKEFFFTSSHLEFYLVKVFGVIAALLCTD
jgi:hypothetical protein